MSDTSISLLLFAATTCCLIAIALTIMWTAAELRRTLRRINTVLPEADQALRATRRSLERANRLLVKADRATTHVETVIHQVCDAASDSVDRFTRFKQRAQALWAGRFGNGAGAGPRRHHRSG